MNPILKVEFTARAGDETIREESVPLHSPQEFFDFVAPGGGCDEIPDDVDEIRMVFLKPEHANTSNPVADCPAFLQLGMVLFNGPLAELVQTADTLLDKAGRGELSPSFMRAIGVKP